MIYKSTHILLPDGFYDGFLQVEKDRIVSLSKKPQTASQAITDLQDLWILPGLIDIHQHGSDGYFDAQRQWSPSEFADYFRLSAKRGITSVMLSLSPSQYQQAAAYRPVQGAARFLGLYSEAYFACSSYLNPDLDFAEINEKNANDLQQMIEESAGLLKYVMIAPELRHAKDMLAYLKSQNIRAAIGHTKCSYQTAKELMDAQLVQSLTHTGNNMGILHQRDGGAMTAGLLHPEVYCELITDFIHIAPEIITLIAKVKDHDHILLVSDTTQLSKLPVGTYNSKGFSVTIHPDLSVRDASGGLCGSYWNLYEDVQKLFCSNLLAIEDIIRMASYNPACFFGLEEELGSLLPNRKADFLITDASMNLQQFYLDGERIQ